MDRNRKIEKKTELSFKHRTTYPTRHFRPFFQPKDPILHHKQAQRTFDLPVIKDTEG